MLACDDVDADGKNEVGQSPLLCAARNGYDRVKGHERVVRLLLSKDNVDPNRRDKHGKTPLWRAISLGKRAIVQLLLERESSDKVVSSTARMLYEAILRRVSEDQSVSVESREKALRFIARARNEIVVGLLTKRIQESPNNLQAAVSGRPKKQIFDETKDKLAYDFLKELDDDLSGGKIASVTASTGGVKVIWNKKFKSTAGRARWRREKTTEVATGQPPKDTGGPSVTYRHVASVELSEEVVIDEDRLLNVMAHEYCHLATCMINGVGDDHLQSIHMLLIISIFGSAHLAGRKSNGTRNR
ncbi:SprT-like family-domain-containing protein [Leptodontidium sp. MPI-SDFR-AT-0119]|nr:SprT-like family-domain-containing protein [Leptodontidium sp. MPI-SDFR-AT-0119]